MTELNSITKLLIDSATTVSGKPGYGLAIPMPSAGANVLVDDMEAQVGPDDTKGDYFYVRLLNPYVEEGKYQGPKKTSCAHARLIRAQMRLVAVSHSNNPVILGTAFRNIVNQFQIRDIAGTNISQVEASVSRTTYVPDEVILSEYSSKDKADLIGQTGMAVISVDFTLTYVLEICNQPTVELC